MRSFFRIITLEFLSFFYFFRSYKSKGFVQFIYFHDISTNELIRFEKLILELKKEYTFISHSEACSILLKNKDFSKNYISISFDDGFKNNLEVGRILKNHNISACFFICPHFIEGLNESEKKNIIQKTFSIKHDQDFMNWKDVNDLIDLGHEIGTHTNTHINLSHNSVPEIINELKISINNLKDKGISVKHFAFPYGRKSDYNFDADLEIRKLELLSICNAVRGIHIQGVSSLFIFRDHIIISWPFRHIKYFLKRNQNRSEYQNIQW